MRRRQVLAAALSVASLAGCAGPGSTGSEPADSDTPDTETAPHTPPPEPTETDTVTPDPDDPILFVLSNETAAEQTVALSLTGPEETYVDESVTLGAGESREFDSGIASPGDYELVVDVENGPETTQTLAIGSYDVRMGSNHFVRVREDEIMVFWEE
ncbi:hypothetical protein [Haloarcula litorea]|uniref:hypothetical protein n=1 Tax=Haloarcula litorea TaxID=3032579 RepID=UPI0023E8CEBA|nr:hypothetical protein [Halomicroarcula sp. GDY20]